MTGAGSSCGACKFLRRKCTSECVFVPYFSYDEAASHFAAVHKVFGASNVSKLLMHIPVHHRTEAAFTISYEALARMTDPVFGCVSHIFSLHQQIAKLQEEIEVLGSQMAAGHPAFTFPSSQFQPTTDHQNLEEAFNQRQQTMDFEQIADIMNTSGGYGNIAEDQSYATDESQQLLCRVDWYPGMEIINEGLVPDHEAPLLFGPLLNGFPRPTMPSSAILGLMSECSASQLDHSSS